MRYVLAFYEIGMAYGGPDEGGWWYKAGELKRIYRTVPNEAAACRQADRGNRLLERLERGLPPLSSITYHGGRHELIAFETVPPQRFPADRPVYS